MKLIGFHPITNSFINRYKWFKRYKERGFSCIRCGFMATHVGYFTHGKTIRQHLISFCKHSNQIKFLTMDHIIPQSKGGKGTKDNLQVLCNRCNFVKGNESEGTAILNYLKAKLKTANKLIRRINNEITVI